MENSRAAHTTDDELSFLDGIVTSRHIRSRAKGRAEKALIGYIEGAKKRVRWGDINKTVAVAHAQRLINTLP